MGAEVLLYPTAIGSEPAAPNEDTQKPWQRVMVGHAVSNALPVAASNRVGREDAITFYGPRLLSIIVVTKSPNFREMKRTLRSRM